MISDRWERMAAWVQARLSLATFAGFLLWTAWLGGILLGGSRFTVANIEFKTPLQADVHLQGTLTVGRGDRDLFGQITSIDHLAFYVPAKFIRNGRSEEIYDHAILASAQVAEFPEGEFAGKLEAYRNPPFFALFHVPTSYLPYRVSVWIWNGISFLGLLFGLLLLRPQHFGQALFWSLTFMPTFTVFSYGQTSLLTFFHLALCYRCFEINRRFLGGFASAFLWMKPPLLMGLLLWWLWDRRYHRALAGCLVGGAFWLAVSYPFIPAAWHEFVAHLPENIRFDNFHWWKSHNARAFWRLMLTPYAAPWPTMLWVASAILGAIIHYRLWRRTKTSLPLMFGLALWMMLWASPHTMIYEWVAVIIPAVLWWKEFPTERNKLLVAYATLWVGLFVSTDFGQIQEMLIGELTNWDSGPIIQVSMLVFLVLSWLLVRWIDKSAFLTESKSELYD